MKGMGSYTPVEMELNHLSIDEINELYLSGSLDKTYDEYERTGEINIKKKKAKAKARKGNNK
ncbi:hypothetical protein CON44_18500 [Bacillus cereus]|nr:hypothetical protein CON44_18500 [Bacillus cereus]